MLPLIQQSTVYTRVFCQSLGHEGTTDWGWGEGFVDFQHTQPTTSFSRSSHANGEQYYLFHGINVLHPPQQDGDTRAAQWGNGTMGHSITCKRPLQGIRSRPALLFLSKTPEDVEGKPGHIFLKTNRGVSDEKIPGNRGGREGYNFNASPRVKVQFNASQYATVVNYFAL